MLFCVTGIHRVCTLLVFNELYFKKFCFLQLLLTNYKSTTPIKNKNKTKLPHPHIPNKQIKATTKTHPNFYHLFPITFVWLCDKHYYNRLDCVFEIKISLIHTYLEIIHMTNLPKIWSRSLLSAGRAKSTCTLCYKMIRYHHLTI